MGVIFKNKVMYGAGDIEISPVCYSEEEREVGCWVDGKPLYQKTYYCNPKVTISANSWGNIATIGDVVNVIKAEAVNNDNGEYAYYSVAGSCSSSKVLSMLNPRSNTGIQVEWVTFYYTKPTDTPGSGIWTPSGVPAVHYSTNEHVVGTWIDGSTVYERSINLGSFSLPGGGTRTIATITGIDKFLCYKGCGVDGVEKYTIPDFGARIKIVNDNIIFQCASNSAWSISEGYVTIRYTKTTS